LSVEPLPKGCWFDSRVCVTSCPFKTPVGPASEGIEKRLSPEAHGVQTDRWTGQSPTHCVTATQKRTLKDAAQKNEVAITHADVEQFGYEKGSDRWLVIVAKLQ